MARIDHDSDRALYRQVADILREEIRSGRYRPGQLLPSEGALQAEHGVGREVVRRALAVLRAEWLVETLDGVGSIVREAPHTETVDLRPGDEVSMRAPTPEERRQLGVPDGVLVFEVAHADGSVSVHAGDKTVLRVADQSGGRETPS